MNTLLRRIKTSAGFRLATAWGHVQRRALRLGLAFKPVRQRIKSAFANKEMLAEWEGIKNGREFLRLNTSSATLINH